MFILKFKYLLLVRMLLVLYTFCFKYYIEYVELIIYSLYISFSNILYYLIIHINFSSSNRLLLHK